MCECAHEVAQRTSVLKATDQTERFLVAMVDEMENRAWAERNAAALIAHGRDIAATGLAGEEFEQG